MVKQSSKFLGLLGLVGLAIIWISYIWEKVSMDQSIDYSLKLIVSLGILLIIVWAIDWLSPKPTQPKSIKK